MQKKSYLYAIIVNGIIRYIGRSEDKGRPLKHSKIAKSINRRRASGEKIKTTLFYNKLAKAIRRGSKITYRMLISGLTAKQVNKAEIKKIAAIRARHPNQLWNTHFGGSGLTAAQARKLCNDIEYKKRHSQGLKNAYLNPELRKRLSESHKRYAATPKGKRHLRRTTKAGHTLKARKKLSKTMRRINKEDPSINKRRSKASRDTWSDPKLRKQQSLRGLERYSDPKERRRTGRLIKKALNNPESRQRLSTNAIEIWSRPKFRKDHSIAMKKNWAKRRKKFGHSGRR